MRVFPASTASVGAESRRGAGIAIGQRAPAIFHAARSRRRKGTGAAVLGRDEQRAVGGDVGHHGVVGRIARRAHAHAAGPGRRASRATPRAAPSKPVRSKSSSAGPESHEERGEQRAARGHGRGAMGRRRPRAGRCGRPRARRGGSSPRRPPPRRSAPASRRWSRRGCPASLRKSITTSLGHFTCARSTPQSRSALATASPAASESPRQVAGPALEAPQQREGEAAAHARHPGAPAPPAPRALPLGGEAGARGRAGAGLLEQARAGRLDLVGHLQAHRRARGRAAAPRSRAWSRNSIGSASR